jgi:tetratricopeptide (TPR) repeat protein
MMLLALMAFGVGMFFARRGRASDAQDSQLAQLQIAVGKPDAKPATWLAYGKALQSAKQYTSAVLAYDQVLKVDPYNREARQGCTYCKAVLNDANKLAQFIEDTIRVDPKLAKAMFEQMPELQKYLSEQRFKDLKLDAIAGSMD